MEKKDTFLFDRRKYLVLIAGLVLLGIGFLLMIGGGAESADEFNPEIFGKQRIGIAPWFIFTGLVLPIVAIMMKPKS
ncbi:MAG: hypothetical protein RL754_7 [Bacteroidota bacterium]|jgi:hypothetical protein